MFRFNLKPHFTRRYSKLVKRNRVLEATVDNVLERLAANPRDPSLRSHKVTAWDSRVAFSVEVTSDLCIIWCYNEGKADLLDLIDLVGHSGAGKVYR